MSRRRLPAGCSWWPSSWCRCVEIYVIIQVGQVIGPWWTILLLVADSMLGTWLIRREGGRAWARLRDALESGRMPAGSSPTGR